MTKKLFVITALMLLGYVQTYVQAQTTPQPVPDKLVVLTFDDAVKSHYTYVAPLLKKYGFNATFYVCEFQQPAFSDTSLYMTWPQIRELGKQGFEIGNHTWHHTHVNKLDEAGFLKELSYIEHKCDSLSIAHPVTFAYPGYDTDVKAINTLQKAGYQLARIGGNRTYNPKADHPYYIPSFSTSGNDKRKVLNAIQQAKNGNVVVLTVHGVPDNAHNWVTTPPELFEEYLQYLHDNHYTVISMKQLGSYVSLESGWKLPPQRMPELATGSVTPMPYEWIDKDTRHKVIQLTRTEGDNASFYFHNNPFVDGRLVYYNTSLSGSRQIFTVNLKSLKTEQITNHPGVMKGEIVAVKRKEVFYQVKDSVFATNVDTKKERLVFVFPSDFKGDITTLNADETLLGGAYGSDKEKELFRQHPEKKDFFNIIYEARLPRTLFTVNINTGELKKVFTDSAWLNHVQFSPSDPSLLMFCHEGPWHKVDRIWTINVVTGGDIKLVHKRTVDMEIAGHEWFGADGKTIWFDLQQPRGKTFFVAGANVQTGKEVKYEFSKNEWSVHYTTSPDQQLFAGDGGDPDAVAKAPDGKWIYLFRPQGDRFVPERLVNMKQHQYKLEPNVHFSPDGKWIIFRANFEGQSQVYAVSIEKQEF
ncbi:Peptidoglycan/xylan/chitin deacetylase, PgdA/CDA1 family [Filimonas lacunae]|uniref:Peptidoglycan/xylan/chitin deacetylase, PgdA/CDA1 family n=1 Tax=Filimonas lacunae TaxID=477680 RepID=A0A173MMI9_9BACT|nr:oligogalacturonate lyase family protein [Filimonas lacunae]BAV08865.1 oligogalacturonate lyase [Filimonas lacunae]SIS63027.1 Peptidoglycan/xylan/chitin deacetylase, PgdA/CDA1 family [Filimonas lacunae]